MAPKVQSKVPCLQKADRWHSLLEFRMENPVGGAKPGFGEEFMTSSCTPGGLAIFVAFLGLSTSSVWTDVGLEVDIV